MANEKPTGKPTHVTLMRKVHRAAEAVLKKAGYEWEVHPGAGVALGLWRNVFVKKTNPRRIVLLPGFGDTPLSWLGVLMMLRPMLAHYYDELVLLDFPGYHGALSDEAMAPSMDLFFQSTASVLDSLQPKTVIGHSLGGWLSAYYASLCGMGRATYAGPEKLVLVCPAGVFGDDAEKSIWTRRFTDSIEHGQNPLEGYLFAHEPAWFKLIAQDFAGFIMREDAARFLMSVRLDHGLEDKIPSIKAKTWLVWGEQDKLIPSKWIQPWMKILSCDRTGILIPDAGHGPYIEKPAVMAAILMQILTEKMLSKPPMGWWKVLDVPQ